LEEQPSEWLLLKAGACKIRLHKIGEAYLRKIPEDFKAKNNTKLVFEIKDDIHKVRQTLLAKNVAMREVKTFGKYGFYICDGEDVEGNIFQLKQRK